jgi:hypothetical protein
VSLRLIVTGMLIPGVLGIGAMAAIVIPRGGDELSWPRLLAGLGALMIVQIGGGYLAGRLSVRSPHAGTGPDCERCLKPTGKPFLYNMPNYHWRCEDCERAVTDILFTAATNGTLTESMLRYTRPYPTNRTTEK